MSGETRSLVELPAGARATIVGVADGVEPHIARRLVDLGLVPGTEVTVVRRAPLRDPTLYRFADTAMCLRAAQARWIDVRVGVTSDAGLAAVVSVA
ncbi:FeoA family protein [Nocardioides sp.]|uniref:FeoA family protein n=1 Tax=Nocardioides sp. TaxID=35761 RepID=UPI0025E204A1|nr:FeoA family protein [Nocardioides sp.]